MFKVGDRAFFVHGFAKNEKGNIRADELAAFKMLAQQMLGYSDTALDAAVSAGILVEVTNDDEAISQ
nr:type II toxin-antitoxin system RelE/ParE family toxin [Niveispirillum sp. BGYR6]